MFKNYDKRGSVLLMVVGLLVILGTLGATFLLVSSLDARQSKLLAGRGKAELIASGGVSKVVRTLGEDLHFAVDTASSPYSAANTTGETAYKNYIDHISMDGHLYGTGGGTTHYSNIFGTGLGENSLVSTESDTGAGDAYLVPTGEFSDDGEQYYIAIKVVDMSSLLSLNTGGYNYISGVTADTSQIPKSPALIRLKDWLGNVATYNAVHQARCGVNSGDPDLTVYDRECGRRLLSPVGSPESSLSLEYMPFGIADEVYLRWLGSGNKANFGRAFDTLNGNASIDQRQMLTTISSSRSILRSPLSGVISPRIDLSKTDALDSDGKNGLYSQIVMLAGSDNGEGGAKDPGVTQLIDNSGTGFTKGPGMWLPIPGVPNAYSNNSTLYKHTVGSAKAWWIFQGLPQATYRVWASWGSSLTAYPAASNVPYLVYGGGTVETTGIGKGKSTTYSGGTLKGTYVANQTELPSDRTFDGQKWQSLGGHWAEGQLVVEIQGPQNVPSGQTQHACADAIRIEGFNINLGSGAQPAAHLTANTWAAMSADIPENTNKAFPFRPPGKDYTVFGVRQQPFITEAFATHTTRTITLGAEGGAVATIDENSWRWGAAIELMNFSDKVIDLSNYKLAFNNFLGTAAVLHDFPAGSTIPAATGTGGGRLVVYDFESGDAALTEDKVFGGATFNAASWKRVTGLNFDNTTVRLVHVATEKGGTKSHNVPIDHVSVGDGEDLLEYPHVTGEAKTAAPPTAQAGKSVNKTITSNCRRDDSVSRQRYAVAKYWKPEDPTETETVVASGGTPPCITADSHKLGADNGIDLTKLPKTKVEEGFRIKLPCGLLSGPGALSDLYLAGPIIYHDDANDDPSSTKAPADLPELLAKDFATKESRGRANSYAENSEHLKNDALPQWKVYPRKRGTMELPWPLLLGEVIETVPMDLTRGDSPTRIYGRININTASADVLKLLPWPTGVNTGTAAQAIINYRSDKGGFITPGEVALALDTLVNAGNKTPDFNRDTIYAAISSCITVNSDMYAVTVRVQIGDSPTPPVNKSWYYLAVIDRGGAVFSTDKPAVLLFTQIK